MTQEEMIRALKENRHTLKYGRWCQKSGRNPIELMNFKLWIQELKQDEKLKVTTKLTNANSVKAMITKLFIPKSDYTKNNKHEVVKGYEEIELGRVFPESSLEESDANRKPQAFYGEIEVALDAAKYPAKYGLDWQMHRTARRLFEPLNRLVNSYDNVDKVAEEYAQKWNYKSRRMDGTSVILPNQVKRFTEALVQRGYLKRPLCPKQFCRHLAARQKKWIKGQ